MLYINPKYKLVLSVMVASIYSFLGIYPIPAAVCFRRQILIMESLFQMQRPLLPLRQAWPPPIHFSSPSFFFHQDEFFNSNIFPLHRRDSIRWTVFVADLPGQLDSFMESWQIISYGHLEFARSILHRPPNSNIIAQHVFVFPMHSVLSNMCQICPLTKPCMTNPPGLPKIEQ